MSKYISLENLERYDAKMQEHFASFCASKEDGMWRQTEKAGAVSFWPVGNSPLEGTVEFKFHEYGPFVGEKGPDNPSVIEGVSSVTLCRTEESVYDARDYSYKADDVSVTEDGDVVYAETNSGSSNKYSSLYCPYDPLDLSENWVFGTVLKDWYPYNRATGARSNGSAWLNVAGDSGSSFAYYAPYSLGYLTSNYKHDRGVYTGEVLPHSNPPASPTYQFRTLSTIPSNGGLYAKFRFFCVHADTVDIKTIDLGGTYYGGSIDLATGLMTVTWEEVAVTGNENWNRRGDSPDSLSVFQSNLGLAAGIMSSDSSANTRFCSHFPYSATWVDNKFTSWGAATNVLITVSANSYPDNTSFKNWLASEYNANHPVRIGYKLATPYTVSLTPPQIRALSQPDKYVPRLNTVYSDAENVQIVYQKNPVRDKFEKVQAIIAQGGNV